MVSIETKMRVRAEERQKYSGRQISLNLFNICLLSLPQKQETISERSKIEWKQEEKGRKNGRKKLFRFVSLIFMMILNENTPEKYRKSMNVKMKINCNVGKINHCPEHRSK